MMSRFLVHTSTTSELNLTVSTAVRAARLLDRISTDPYQCRYMHVHSMAITLACKMKVELLKLMPWPSLQILMRMAFGLFEASTYQRFLLLSSQSVAVSVLSRRHLLAKIMTLRFWQWNRIFDVIEDFSVGSGFGVQIKLYILPCKLLDLLLTATSAVRYPPEVWMLVMPR